MFIFQSGFSGSNEINDNDERDGYDVEDPAPDAIKNLAGAYVQAAGNDGVEGLRQQAQGGQRHTVDLARLLSRKGKPAVVIASSLKEE